MCVFIYCKCKVYLVAIHSGALKSWISVLMDRNDPQGGIVVVCESPFIFGLLPGYPGSVFRAVAFCSVHPGSAHALGATG